MLSEYNSIRLWLYNSQALLEGTNLVLFNINKGVLVATCVTVILIFFYLLPFRQDDLRTTAGEGKLL